MPSTITRWTVEERQADIDRAIAEGRHSTKAEHVCGLCREWGEHYHVMQDGVAICRVCWKKYVKPAEEEELKV